MTFKVGDRVEAMIDHIEGNETLLKGDTGTIVRVWEGGNTIGVRWDFPVRGGHDCGGYCERGYGWNVYLRYLQKSSQDKDSILGGDIEVDSSDLLALFGGAYHV